MQQCLKKKEWKKLIMNYLKDTFNRIKQVRGIGQVVTVTAGLIVMVIAFGIMNPVFFSQRNINNLLRQIAPILLIGIGQSYVLITGNIDLSIGSIIGMSSMVSATLMTNGANPWVALSVALLGALVIGVLNGLLVVKGKLPPFIATLGTMTIARGIAQIVNNNYNTDSIGSGVQSFRDLFYYGKTFGIYNPVWIAIIIWIIFNFVLRRTRTGRYIYAIGSNTEAARLSGVNVLKTTITVYLVSAFTASIAGFIQTASSGMGAMDAGNGYELFAVAASVIGGVSTLGGQGLLVGTIVGASIWAVLENGLQFVGAPVAIRNIVIGVIVIVSVLLDVILRRNTNKSSRKISS